jgi:multidrug efflux pump subunit AcrB
MEADLLNGVARVEAIRSKSLPGLSSVQVVLRPGTDMFRARQLVAERLTQARALPSVSAALVLMQPLSSTSRVMMARLTSKDMSPIDMSVLARWTMKPALLAVPGVANISIWGQRDQQLQVLVDPKQLEAKGVTLDQIIRTTGNSVWVSPLSCLEASTPGTGGFLEKGHQRLGVVGGVLAAYFTGGVLSLGSLVGFLTVMGIAARNGILLISHCQHLERIEGLPRRHARPAGAGERLSPILMTTLATGLALVPLVVMGGCARA